MVEILENYDVLAAFWMTVYLAFFAAIGSLLIGTVLAVMRVSPVGVLRGLGAFYVNTVRNTPLTLILLFCVLGVLYVLQVPLAPTDSPTSVRDNAIRWAIVGLSVYHAFRGAIAPLGSVLIALIKNTTVASIIGVAEASGLMKTIIENETASVTVFLVFAIGFVILTLPVGVLFTSLSRRLAVKR